MQKYGYIVQREYEQKTLKMPDITHLMYFVRTLDKDKLNVCRIEIFNMCMRMTKDKIPFTFADIWSFWNISLCLCLLCDEKNRYEILTLLKDLFIAKYPDKEHIKISKAGPYCAPFLLFTKEDTEQFLKDIGMSGYNIWIRIGTDDHNFVEKVQRMFIN